MAFNASATKLSASQSGHKKKGAAPRKRRKTKGPSQKIRSLAALSLAPKIGYLKLRDLVVTGNAQFEKELDKLPRRSHRKGDNIYPTRKSEPMLFLVKSGSVDIFRPSSLGNRFSVASIEPGVIFGEMPLVGQSMLGAHAEAAEPSEVIHINASDFERLASASPDLMLNLMRKLGPRLVEAERKHEQAAFQPVTSRVASLLIKLAGKSNQVVGYTHQEMADILGVYRETVTNAIAELKHDGLIQVGRKRITLINPEGLLKLESF